MLVVKQNSGISRVSCVLEPSQISTCGWLLARSLVSGSNMRWSHCKLMYESVYPVLEHTYCHLGIGKVVELFRWIPSSTDPPLRPSDPDRGLPGRELTGGYR